MDNSYGGQIKRGDTGGREGRLSEGEKEVFSRSQGGGTGKPPVERGGGSFEGDKGRREGEAKEEGTISQEQHTPSASFKCVV